MFEWQKIKIPEQPPAGFFDRPIRRDMWLRAAQAVLVLATNRHSTFQDIGDELATIWADVTPSAMFNLLHVDLPRYHLAITDVIPIIEGEVSIGLIRLTERGKELARALGVLQIGESDWERILRLQGDPRTRRDD